MTKTVKTPNYTAEMTAEMIASWRLAPTKETVSELAAKFGKTTQSIVAKLSREKVYRRAEYVAKNGEKPEKILRKENCNYPTFAVSLERLATANVSVELHEDTRLLIFTDYSETLFSLFDNETVNNLVNQFGEHRTDSMLDETTHIVRRETMVEKIRKAMRE